MSNDDIDERQYRVVLNDEEQYSIWLADHDLPRAGARRVRPGHVRHAWHTSASSGPTCDR